MKMTNQIISYANLTTQLRIPFFLIVSLTLTSCKKFLEIDPPISSLVTEKVFQNDGQATAAMAGVYSIMSTDGNYASGGSGSISLFAGASADEMLGYNLVLPYYENQLTPELANLKSMYLGPYNSIYSANSILEGLSTSTGVTPPTKSQLEGEALFVRAFAYFYLTNIFGEIPLQLTSDYRVTSTASKSTIDIIYQQIKKDLKQAEDLLTDSYPTVGRVRPNKSAVQALLARVYLYNKDWENAERYSSLVIGKVGTYNLVDFDAIFLANSQETIWQLMPPANSNSPSGTLFIPSLTTSIPTVVSLSNSLGSIGFEQGDKRQLSWVRTYTIGSTKYYYPFKYKVRASTPVTEYSTVLRLAEQYLIRAEARINQEGKIGLGIVDLNIIRQRPLSNGTNGNLIPALSTNLSKSDALLAVEQERKVELFSEWGHRWFDLKRTNRAEPILALIKPNWQSTDLLYPIPTDELSRNKKITQNEGY